MRYRTALYWLALRSLLAACLCSTAAQAKWWYEEGVSAFQISSEAKKNQHSWRFYQNTPVKPPHIDSAEPHYAHRIAIIIDDIGYQRQTSISSAQLPGAITLAVLPFTPYADLVATLAYENGKELMLHVPMAPEVKSAWNGGLDGDMSESHLRDKLNQMLNSLPGIAGINNHMGSALTQDAQAMSWVMDELAKRNLYFVDSRTTAKTQALKAAQETAIPSARRDVFLDNVRTPEAIALQFEKLLNQAESKGAAIGIGHPYPETLAFLNNIEPLLNERGIRLVAVSDILVSPLQNTRFLRVSDGSLE